MKLPSIDKIVRYGCSKTTLIVLLGIILLHLAVMVIYINDNRTIHRRANRDAVIQKIINMINLLEATPIKQRAKAIAALNDPDLKASITLVPKYELRFKEISFWRINKSLRQQLNSFSISILLEKKQWLNISAMIYTHVLLKQLSFLVLEIVVFAFIIFLSWAINRFVTPIEELKHAALRFSADLNTHPILIDGPSVVQEAANAMNKMQQQIKHLVRNRTQMLAAISHDLRTPITRMKLQAHLIDDDNAQEGLINNLDEMEVMINETLSFARDDYSVERKVDLDLVSLVRSVCESMNDIGHPIKFHCKWDRIKVLGRTTALKRVFNNLIGNAIRYAQNVSIKIHYQYGQVTIMVEDNGHGIAEEELEQVFQPFYREEKSRSRDTGGVGLGLAVTRDIITDHNGRIYLRNRAEGGLCATVELPADIS